MANQTMSLERAKEIVAHVVEVRRKWKRLASPNVTLDELYDALVVLNDVREDTTLRDELTKVNRQYAACRNREKARKAKLPEHVGEDEEVT
jgi:hypothetical protein